MKTAVACAAAFVAALALIARSADVAPAPVPKATPPAAAGVPDGRVADATRSVAAEPVAAPEARPVPPASAPAPVTSGLRAPTPRTLAGKLEQELGLSAVQRNLVEEIFRRRDADVAAIQRRVLQAGFFSARQTEPELAALREDSYRQISMLLDDAQNRRFAEVLSMNLINDHTVITLPDSLVLLD